MNDSQTGRRPIALVEGRTAEHYLVKRPTLAGMTPMNANRILASMLYLGGMDHLRAGGDGYQQLVVRMGWGEKPLGPKVMVRPASFKLNSESFLHDVLVPARQASSDFNSLLAGLGQYGLSSIGESDVAAADIRRLEPVFARAWETIDEAKRSDNADVRGLAQVMDQAIHEAMGRNPNKRTLTR